jgi:hypothetical protein
MRTRAISLTCVALSCIAIASSCSEDITATSSDEKIGIETIVKVSPRRVVQGEVVEIEVLVKNHGPDTLSIRFSHWQMFGYRILTHNRELFDYYPKMVSPALNYLYLEPGNVEIRTFSYSGIRGYNAADVSWHAGLGQLPIGIYIVQGGLREHSDEYPWGEARLEVIE